MLGIASSSCIEFRGLPIGVGMRAKEVVISYKECNMSVRASATAISISDLIREFESPVKTLYNLLLPAIFSRNWIVICQPNNLSEIKIHVINGELLLCYIVCTVAIGDKFQSLAWELSELGESHTHG